MALTLDTLVTDYSADMAQPQYHMSVDDVRQCATSAREHGRYDLAINLEALADSMLRTPSDLDLTNGASRDLSRDTEHARG